MKSVKVHEKRTRYHGYFRVDEIVLQHRRFDGTWTPPITREVFERGHAVAALLYDPDLDCLVLIEQFRIGVFAAGEDEHHRGNPSPWLIEIVAGIIEEGETPEDVVRREALEEAGCDITDLEHACTLFASPGASTETIAIYCGRVDASLAGGLHGLEDEGEDIRVLKISAEDAFRRLDAGEIVNATALVGLYWFRVHHNRLRETWARSTPSDPS